VAHLAWGGLREEGLRVEGACGGGASLEGWRRRRHSLSRQVRTLLVSLTWESAWERFSFLFSCNLRDDGL
jgi:hypothetical protein